MKISLKLANLSEVMFILFSSLLIFAVAMLPSGNIGNINVKLLFAGLALISTTFHLVNFGLKKFQALLIILLLIYTTAIGFWFVLGTININIYAFDQLKSLLTTILIIFLIMPLFFENNDRLRKILSVAILGNAVYCIFKITIVASIYLKIYTFDQFLELSRLFDVNPITLEILPGLIRVQTISDVLSPFLLYILLTEKILPNPVKNITMITFGISIFLSYSRAIWLLTAVIFLLNLLRKGFSRLDIKLLIIISASILVFFGAIYYSGDAILNRFNDKITVSSDQIRTIQLSALLNGFSENILIGKGLGAYVSSVVRDTEAPFSYEIQWVALLMQFGVIGIFILALPILIGFFFILNLSKRLDWPILYAIWISLSFTNPYLTSSISGLIFIVCLLAPALNRRKNESNDRYGDL